MRFLPWHYYKKVRNIGMGRAAYVIIKRVYKKGFSWFLARGGLLNWVMPKKQEFSLWIAHRRNFVFFSLKTIDDGAQADVARIADAWVVYGLRLRCFDWHAPWHTDTRVSYFNFFDRYSFSSDMKIGQHGGDNIGPDIKVPWELSRFYYFPLLAAAYNQTGDKKYLETIRWFFSDWQRHNDFGRGINWCNPMEIGLRSINWIITFQAIEQDLMHDEKIKWAYSLYEHYIYLKYNEEYYDGRTNNHYLSDLVGMLYLCWFFKDMPSMKSDAMWCVAQLVKEIDWQIFDEGSSYEGSTAYHALVKELVLHGWYIAREMGIVLPERILKKISLMQEFQSWCTPNNQSKPIMIGDDDSGYVVHPLIGNVLPIHDIVLVSKRIGTNRYFKQFGISIYKDENWHITLRHNAYTSRQPSAHFHYDWAGITLSYQGVAVIVDPGSFVYTASSTLRNIFRSADMQSGWYVGDAKKVSDSLFAMDIPLAHDDDSYMHTQYYYDYGLVAHRMVEFAGEIIAINDWVEHAVNIPQLATWHIIFHPDINLESHNDGWLIFHHKKPLMVLISNISFELISTWYAPIYGVKQHTMGLRARQPVGNDRYFIRIRLVS